MLLLPLLLLSQLTCNDIVIPTSTVMRLPPGECVIKTPLVLSAPTTIIGAPNQATRIRAQKGFVGASDRLSLENLYIWRADFATETGTRAIAINTTRPPRIENLRIEGFVVGIMLQGTMAEGANIDWWLIRDVEIINSAFASIYVVESGNSSAGYGSHIRAITSCKRADQWEKYFGVPCAGIVDKGFLGNFWFGLQIATTLNKRPPLIADGANAHHTIVGLYCEGGQPAPLISNRSMILGGACEGSVAKGLRLDGNLANGMEFVNDMNAANVVRTRLGRAAGPNNFECLVSDQIDKSRPLCTQAEVRGAEAKDKCYTQRIANQLRPGEVCQDGSKK